MKRVFQTQKMRSKEIETKHLGSHSSINYYTGHIQQFPLLFFKMVIACLEAQGRPPQICHSGILIILN